jgi:hypothetical protein
MIWHPYLNPLRDALARLFPYPADWRTAAATAGLDPAAIAFDAKAVNSWQAILEEAHRQDKVTAIADYAVARFPVDAALIAARKTYADGMAAGHEEAPPGQSAAAPQHPTGVTINIANGGTISGSSISFGNVAGGNITGGNAPPAPARPAAGPPAAGVDAHQELVRLRKLMVDRLSDSDLRDLCFDLGIDYEDLGGEGRAGKARGLLEYCSRRDLVAKLVAAGKALRPDMPWESA